MLFLNNFKVYCFLWRPTLRNLKRQDQDMHISKRHLFSAPQSLRFSIFVFSTTWTPAVQYMFDSVTI